MASNEPCQNLCYGECALRDALERLNLRGYLDANPCAGDEGNADLKFARDALAAAPKPEQQEAPELTDEEIIELWKATRGWRTAEEFAIPYTRAVIAAHEAKRRATDPADEWRKEGFNDWRRTRATKPKD